MNDFNGPCLKAVIGSSEVRISFSSADAEFPDYLYTGEIADALELATLLDIIDFSHMWDLQELNELTQQKIVERRLIRPETYEAGQ